MPDWSYHPLLRPLGVGIHGDKTRDVALRRLAQMCHSRLGRRIFAEMADARPDASLVVHKNGLTLSSPLVLDKCIDPTGAAREAFVRLGFGAVEVEGSDGASSLIDAASAVVAVVSVQPSASARRTTMLLEASTGDIDLNGAAGVVMDVSADADWPSTGQRLRDRYGPEILIGVRGRFSSPAEVIDAVEAGADLVFVGEGLVEAGPALPRRSNELLTKSASPGAFTTWRRSAIAGALFGLGVVVAALIATYVAVTSVILGYDEHFTQMSRSQLRSVNPRLLDFMSHDRLSYAGATLSLGVLYLAVAVFGVSKGRRWAYRTFVVTGIAGFSTFFLFIGFGYFDVGNSAVMLVLLPFFVIAAMRRPEYVPLSGSMDRFNDNIWRRGIIGQLLLVTMSVGLIVGGLSICVVGVTNVFVISDLDFLRTTSVALESSNSRLLPLIAHDRVSFGGGIVCNGIAALLISLWGFRRGEAWVWWSLLVAGSCNLGFTFYAHFVTGYTELGHLAPVVVGALFFGLGLAASRDYLCAKASV